jgi:hypothetical protein
VALYLNRRLSDVLSSRATPELRHLQVNLGARDALDGELLWTYR